MHRSRASIHWAATIVVAGGCLAFAPGASAADGPPTPPPLPSDGAPRATEPRPAKLSQGVRLDVVKLVGSFLPGAEPDMGSREPHTVPVHVFRGRVEPFHKPNPKHPALVKIVKADRMGRIELPLPPGEYTAVLELDSGLYLNNWLEDGSWAIFEVKPKEWTSYIVEDVTEAQF
ncbi:MAG: hypothetical protein WD066_18790 [Planctomycetaceae bacterium]